MSKIIVDQIQKLTGGVTAFNIPTADGTAGQYMKTDGSANLGWSSMTNPNVASIPGIPVPEGVGIIGSIVSRTDRGNTYSTGEWTSSGPWTTYYNYDIASNNNAIQFMNMALGDGMQDSGTSENMFGNDSEHQFGRTLQYSNGTRLGYSRNFFHYDNLTTDTGCSFRLLPIRNTTSAAISINLYAYVSNYWGSGYEGGSLAVFAPNAGLYSAVTTVTGTNLATISSTNGNQNSLSGSYSIPANTTVIVGLSSSDWYYTTYQFRDTNYFSQLDTTFTNPGIICDMRMLQTLHSARFTSPMTYAGGLSGLMPGIWKQVALQYGDR